MTSQIEDKITPILNEWKILSDTRKTQLDKMIAITKAYKEQYEFAKSAMVKTESEMEELRIRMMENSNTIIQNRLFTEDALIAIFRILGRFSDSINDISGKKDIIESLQKFQMRAEPTLDSLREYVDEKVEDIQKMNKGGE